MHFRNVICQRITVTGFGERSPFGHGVYWQPPIVRSWDNDEDNFRVQGLVFGAQWVGGMFPNGFMTASPMERSSSLTELLFWAKVGSDGKSDRVTRNHRGEIALAQSKRSPAFR
jgi:hypothetical protein